MRQRDDREGKALAMMRWRQRASALEIGSAAVAGEKRSRRMRMRDRELIGLGIASEWVRRGLAAPTRDNCFEACGRDDKF
jgi:hypothetical protein